MLTHLLRDVIRVFGGGTGGEIERLRHFKSPDDWGQGRWIHWCCSAVKLELHLGSAPLCVCFQKVDKSKKKAKQKKKNTIEKDKKIIKPDKAEVTVMR